MTNITIQCKQIKMTIEEKAHLIQVIDIHEPNRLAVTSGDFDSKDAYVVHHIHGHSTYCPCDAWGFCSHRLAADWYLEAQARADYRAIFELDYVG